MSGERYVRLTEDMRAIIASERLCFAATVTADGRPNLSPKGTIRVWGDHTLAFLDLASPGTRENLAVNPWMELNVVDTTSRRGYRFLGQATYHRGDEVHNTLERRISDEEGHEYAADGVILLPVERALPALGFDGVSGVSVGKSIRFQVDATDRAAAAAEVDDLCHRFLSNPVIEDSFVTIAEPATTGA